MKKRIYILVALIKSSLVKKRFKYTVLACYGLIMALSVLAQISQAQTWKNSTTGLSLNNVWILNSTKGWAVGENRLIQSTTGSGELSLTGSPNKVTISGTNAAGFTITTQPSSPVAATNGTTMFQITFEPSASGTRIPTVIISNDDSNENS
jgi:hypothetical protein